MAEVGAPEDIITQPAYIVETEGNTALEGGRGARFAGGAATAEVKGDGGRVLRLFVIRVIRVSKRGGGNVGVVYTWRGA